MSTSTTPAFRFRMPPPADGRPLRRVRHEVRDGVAVIAFSAAASTALAGAILLVVTLVGQAV